MIDVYVLVHIKFNSILSWGRGPNKVMGLNNVKPAIHFAIFACMIKPIHLV